MVEKNSRNTHNIPAPCNRMQKKIKFQPVLKQALAFWHLQFFIRMVLELLMKILLVL